MTKVSSFECYLIDFNGSYTDLSLENVFWLVPQTREDVPIS